MLKLLTKRKLNELNEEKLLNQSSNKSNKSNKQDRTKCCQTVISDDIINNWNTYQYKNTCIYCQHIDIVDKHIIFSIERDNQEYEKNLMADEDIDIQEQPCSKTYFRDDYMVECERCGRIWDGHAQCDCWLFYLSDSE